MPIVDYKHKADIAHNNLLSRKDISEKNLSYLKSFFDAYDVSPARLSLFCKHIGFLLSRTPDIKKDMHDKAKINSIFNDLRKKIKPGYYTTVVNVSLRFVKWLNEGVKPKGFLDITNKPKRTQRRDLKPSDMVAWEEGLKMVENTTSAQLKAIVMTQLDAGLRPSEFIDLEYGSVSKEGKYLVINVEGKTGKRDVLLWECIPHLQRWLQMHPTRKAHDPLWIMENMNKSRRDVKGIVKYDYFAVAKRVRELGKKAGIKKPLDFYNLRHSSAVIKKLKNWPLDLAAKNMGHSVEYFDEVYGRLSLKDETERLDKVHGLTTEQEAYNNPIECKTCLTINEPGKEFCEQCGSPLTLKKALEVESRKDKELEELKEQMVHMNKILQAIQNERKINEN